MDIQILGVAVGLCATIFGIGWKISTCMNDIRNSVTRIEALLQATSQRLDRVEAEIKAIDNRLREHETNER
jgi:hypothetical protein